MTSRILHIPDIFSTLLSTPGWLGNLVAIAGMVLFIGSVMAIIIASRH